MNFKELVKDKEAWFETWNERDITDVHMSHAKRYIGIKEIGNWAWKLLEKSGEIEEYFDQLPSQANYEINLESIMNFADKGEYLNICWEIAVACLGEKEVIKKLKESEK